MRGPDMSFKQRALENARLLDEYLIRTIVLFEI